MNYGLTVITLTGWVMCASLVMRTPSPAPTSTSLAEELGRNYENSEPLVHGTEFPGLRTNHSTPNISAPDKKSRMPSAASVSAVILDAHPGLQTLHAWLGTPERWHRDVDIP